MWSAIWALCNESTKVWEKLPPSMRMSDRSFMGSAFVVTLG